MLNATFICCLYDMMKHHGFGRSRQIYFQGPNLLKSLAYDSYPTHLPKSCTCTSVFRNIGQLKVKLDCVQLQPQSNYLR